jgi:undecaprenyl diphosphate synthase
MKVLINSLKELLTLQKKQHQLNAIGNPERLPKICAKGTPDVIDKTKNNTQMTLT